MDIPRTHQSGASPRDYHTFTTDNGLRVCVISDPTADKAAASASVHAGQLHDTVPGVAHLTEHMLFMGSTSFPVENEYDGYLQQHGGHSNAYTDLEQTVFYFDVTTADGCLKPSLERLACALGEPLLRVESLERELQAVDSEHAKNVTQDHWRIHQLARTLLGTGHPYSNFGTGCKESLLQIKAGDESSSSDNDAATKARYQVLRDEIMSFYQLHYTPNNMTLAVLGKESVAELQALVEETFVVKLLPQTPSVPPPVPALSPTRGVPSDSTAASPIQPPPTVVEWVPLRPECSLLELQWIVPWPQPYDTKPARHWSHLLGHEGTGTLLAVLRDRQWAHDLTADDVSTQCQTFGLFVLSLELTPLGFVHVTEILHMIRHYLCHILAEVPDWVGEELTVTGETAFTFLAKREASGTVSSLASAMHLYPPEHILSGAYKLFARDPELVRTMGTLLQAPPALILLGSDTYQETVDTVDPWYGTKYRVVTEQESVWSTVMQESKEEKIDKAVVSSLALPARNDMLPTDFGLVVEESPDLFQTDGVFGAPDAPPRCLVDTDTCRLWFKPDMNYRTPKVNYMALLRSPVLLDGRPETAVLASLWVELATELCNEFSYDASIAGLHCGFQETSRGMEVQVSGYNHKAGILLKRICDTFVTKLPQAIQDELFLERIRAKLELQYHAALVAQPYQHGSMAADLVLEASSKGLIQKRLEHLGNKTLVNSNSLLQFSHMLLSQFRLEALVHGNVKADVATEWTNIILDTLKPTASLRIPALRGVQLPMAEHGTECIYRLKGWNEHDENSCVVNLYQIGPVDIPTNATLSLLLQLLREPAFNILRTEEQLGYIVFSSIKTAADGIKHLLLLIQSDSFDPVHVDGRIEAFLTQFRTKILLDMSDEDFQNNVTAVCESMLEKNKNLGEESSKHWSVITNCTYKFRRLQEIAQAAKQLTKADVLAFFDLYVQAQSGSRRKLSIQLYGTAHESKRQDLLQKKTESSATHLIDDPDEFVRHQALYPAQIASAIDDLFLN